MDPPLTSSPPNRFTPSRCAFESRPFLELPRPFLCAMNHLCQNLAHPHRRVVLAVADGALVLFLPLELEDEDLVAPAVLDDGALYLRRSEAVARNQLIRIANYGQHRAEFHLGADIAGQSVYPDHVARRDTKLLSTCFDYGVHIVFLYGFTSVREIACGHTKRPASAATNHYDTAR